ncbi:TetR/AcrR family transcriptional regulator [Entomohabitans teleogrylli]|uniref:TetR/AcrR family transcriptional regulator n=1 Tax=Entomohabitans teleogrylli TaxID=1384589 RepID=UPI00073D3B9A|nr:TetR/AcrR family transcriptional regulator [Entomohabitans teleogrylli]
MANSPGRPMKARPKIVQAACEMFLEHGLDVSLDMIATRAGTTRQTLYNHFSGKDALLLETFNFLNGQMQPSIRDILAASEDDFPQRLRRIAGVVQGHFYHPQNLHFHRLLIQVLMQRPELYTTLQQRQSQRILQTLAEALRQACDSGEITLSNPAIQAAAFLGAVMGYPLPAALIELKPVDPQWLEQLASAAIDSFLCAWHYQPVA